MLPYEWTTISAWLQPQGSIFQNGFLSGGQFKKYLKKWSFWAKSGGLFKKNPKNWTFHITWDSILEWGSIMADTVLQKFNYFVLTGPPVSLVLLRSKDISDFLQEKFGNILGISHFRLQKSLKSYCRCKYLKIKKNSAHFLFAIWGTCNIISIIPTCNK